MSFDVFRGSLKPEVSREELLRLTPVKNSELDWETSYDGVVSVIIPPKRLSFGRTKKVVFDQMGSYVIGLIDGRRTVDGIIQTVVASKKLSESEARISVVTFIQTLENRGFIEMEVREQVKEGVGKFCKECGERIPVEALFCPQCGTRQG